MKMESCSPSSWTNIDSSVIIDSPSLQAAVQLVHVVTVQHRPEESRGQPAVLHVSHPPQLLLPAHVLDGDRLGAKCQSLSSSAPPPRHD